MTDKRSIVVPSGRRRSLFTGSARTGEVRKAPAMRLEHEKAPRPSHHARSPESRAPTLTFPLRRRRRVVQLHRLFGDTFLDRDGLGGPSCQPV